MKRLMLAAGAGLLAAAIASPSLAADYSSPGYKPPPEPYVAPFGWTGAYVGINGGYGWGSSDWTSSVTSGGTDPGGGQIGATIGYNLQYGNWVWGLEGDVDYNWIDDTDTAGTGVCAGLGCKTEVPWFGTFRGRVGYVYGHWMPYVTGGGAFAVVRMTPAAGIETSDSSVGWTLGVGLEYGFSAALSFKVEYLYADLGDVTCDVATCGINTNVSYTSNFFRFGLNYRF
jgi:outer membrane immunogenic protein